MPETTCKEAAISDAYFDYIFSPEYPLRFGYNGGYCIQPIAPAFTSAYVSAQEMPSYSIENAHYTFVPKLYGLMEGTVSDSVRTISLQQDSYLGLTGEGILLGIIGTGINYQSPSFRNEDGTTRIAGIWDQTIQTGTPPEEIVYGSSYSSEQINEALASDDPLAIVPSQDTNGFGTYLASAAAASENPDTLFRGVAPAATLGIVKLKQAKPYLKEFYAVRPDAEAYQENDIMLGIKYLSDLSDSLQMPLVICLSLGTSMGNHGTGSFLSQYIDDISIGTKCVVCGTGNEANQRHHFMRNMMNEQEYIDVEVRVENNSTGFFMELWNTDLDILTVGVISPSGELLPRIPYQTSSRTDYRFVFEQSKISISYQITGDTFFNSLTAIRMESPANGIWTFRIYGTNVTLGIFHLWLPISEFIEGDTYFLSSNPDATLTEPASSLKSISTSAYDSQNNSIFLESGRGYPVNGNVKPYFASPGVAVPGITLRDTPIKRSGTSSGATLTAGACALIFQWAIVLNNDPFFNTTRLSALLIRGAERSPNRQYPSHEWGFGALDLNNTFANFRPI